MVRFPTLSLQRKQMLILMVTSCAALLLASAGFVTYEVTAFRRTLVEHLTTLAEVLGNNASSAVDFNDQHVAEEVLGALRAEPNITAACIYTSDGTPFAQYQRPGSTTLFQPSPVRSSGYQFGPDRLELFRDITQHEEFVGTIYLESDLRELTHRLRQYAGIVAGVLLAAMLGAYLLSARLQRVISRPILNLVQATRAVAQQKNYAVRVAKGSQDELGNLIDDFNEMLAQIQSRDSALQDAQGKLEKRVAERTKELEELAARQGLLHAELREAYDELRATQQAALQQERLRALGQMASGIAHDINNALVPIMGYADLLLMNDSSGAASDRLKLECIKKSCLDIARTVERMKEFYRHRDGSEPLQEVNLARLVRDVVALTRPRWSDIPQQQGVVIELKEQLESLLPPVLGVESELRQALVNLVINAVDAMPQGGRITLRAARSGTPPAPASPAANHFDRWVLLEVADTGTGMDEDTRRRCLEPFFTTKGERGTGLGLAMVYGVLERHEGRVEIDSSVGRGTTVRLLLPLRSPAAEKTAPATASGAERRSLRLLCIDDEPVVLKVLGALLAKQNHDVVVSESGPRGLELFRRALAGGQPFDAVITDLGMPGMDGRAVAAAVKLESPQTSVVLLTGWGMFLTGGMARPPGVDHVLSKPVDLKGLQAVLESVAAPRS